MTSTHTPFRIPVADLLRRPGASRAVATAGPLPGLASPGAEVPEGMPVTVDVTLERVSEGIVVRGTVAAHWQAACSRCLAPVEGDAAVHVDELFEREPLEGETYQLDADVLDLEPLARDALVLELPAVPICRAECQGLCPACGVDRNTTECDCTSDELDPRWAALRSLDL
jgi:uncharacterized protein